jgi:DNA-binding transcriptional ArsR family regulator
MRDGLLGLVGESKALNSKLFSLPRLLILSALEELPEGEGATYRELKASLGLGDGVLFANLNVLAEMGYVKLETVKVGNEKMTSYAVTNQGREEFRMVKIWMKKLLGGDEHGKPA